MIHAVFNRICNFKYINDIILEPSPKQDTLDFRPDIDFRL